MLYLLLCMLRAFTRLRGPCLNHNLQVHMARKLEKGSRHAPGLAAQVVRVPAAIALDGGLALIPQGTSE